MKVALLLALVLILNLLNLLYKAKEESKGWEMLANHTAHELEEAERKLREHESNTNS